jgi:hypothetical protein
LTEQAFENRKAREQHALARNSFLTAIILTNTLYLHGWFNAILGAKYATVMDHVIREK